MSGLICHHWKISLIFPEISCFNRDLIFLAGKQFIQNESASLGKNIVAANQTGMCGYGIHLLKELDKQLA